MQPCSRSRRFERRQALGHEGSDDAGENVASTRSGQSFVTVGDEQHVATGIGDDGGGPLQQHDHLEVSRETTGFEHPVRSGTFAAKQGELSIVRRDHRWGLAPGQRRSRALVGPHESEQRVGVDDERYRRLGDELAH